MGVRNLTFYAKFTRAGKEIIGTIPQFNISVINSKYSSTEKHLNSALYYHLKNMEESKIPIPEPQYFDGGVAITT